MPISILIGRAAPRKHPFPGTSDLPLRLRSRAAPVAKVPAQLDAGPECPEVGKRDQRDMEGASINSICPSEVVGGNKWA